MCRTEVRVRCLDAATFAYGGCGGKGRAVASHAAFPGAARNRRLRVPAPMGDPLCCLRTLCFLEAMEEGRVSQARALMPLASANVEQHGRTPLSTAVQAMDLALCKDLLRSGARPDFGSRPPLSLLARSAEKDDDSAVAIASLLIAAGADVNLEYDGTTPLYWAARSNNPQLAALLLHADADPSKSDYRGRTPLWLAAHHGYSEVVALLLQHGNGACTMQVAEGKTPREAAAAASHRQALALFDAHSPSKLPALLCATGTASALGATLTLLACSSRFFAWR